MKVTKKQLTRIIREELAHSPPAIMPKEVPVVQDEGPSYMDEALAGALIALADDDRKGAVAGVVRRVADAPWDLVTSAVDALCGKVSSWEKWGAYQSTADKTCRVLGRIIAAPGPGMFKVVWNAAALALSVLPKEMINDFAADSYPETRAGAHAAKVKLDRETAKKKASTRKRRAVKESIRRIVAKETNKRER